VPETEQVYAQAMKYSLGISNNAAGLLNLFSEQEKRVQLAENRASSAELSMKIFYEIYQRIERIIKSATDGETPWNLLEVKDLISAVSLPSLKQGTPEELQAAVDDWIQTYNFKEKECNPENKSQ
jgi:hypothetical protein